MQRKRVNMIRSHGHECHFVRGVIRGHSTVASNQSSPPGMQRAVGYKMHCSFVSPIPFNYAVQKGRRIVSERGVSATKTRQYHPESRTRVTISEAATQGYSTVAPSSGKIQPIRAFLPACRRRSPSRSYKRAAAVPLP